MTCVIIGFHSLPLDYLMRRDDEPVVYDGDRDTYESFEALAKDTVPFGGFKYEMDNEHFYKKLIALLKDTTAMECSLLLNKLLTLVPSKLLRGPYKK